MTASMKLEGTSWTAAVREQIPGHGRKKKTMIYQPMSKKSWLVKKILGSPVEKTTSDREIILLQNVSS